MNYYDHAIQQIQSIGIQLDKPLLFDGRIQRWLVAGEGREKRGWTRLREWTSNRGNTYIVGAYGVWHGNDDGYTKIQIGSDDKLDATDLAALRDAHKAAAKAVADKRKEESITAARWASSVWAHCTPATDHDYLTRKGIKPNGARILASTEGIVLDGIDDSNWYRLTSACAGGHVALVIPMHNAKGDIVGLQFVYGRGHPRKQKLERDKEFWPSGMAMGGSFGLIGAARPGNGIMLITEGFATAASLHQATGYSVCYAFSANNLAKAGEAYRSKNKGLRILFCADDDYLTDGNPGCTEAAHAAAKIDNSAWTQPDFTGPDGRDLRDGKKLSDYNDLAVLSGIPLVLADQINAALDKLGWRTQPMRGGAIPQGGGEINAGAMPPSLSIEEGALRYWGTYGLGGKVLFDEVERRLVTKDDVLNLLPDRAWSELKRHPAWRVARDTEIGFDPTEKDPQIKCNLFGGWPTTPAHGDCTKLLELLEYMCALEVNDREIYLWILKWLAYPLQHRGAKMHSAIVVHGPQGTGKSRFFEAYARIFGPYGRVLGQEALEDKFNADWAEKKLFILADEVLARTDMYHIKNRLKGFITGDTIRVNPKNVAAHNEKNQMNIVFLSNERQPLVLENDDRRHCVLWVPPKLDESFFAAVNAEIDNGGIEALHQYLLDIDLGDFKPWTKPPMTKAKQDLIDLGTSSEERFVKEWIAGELEGIDGDPLPFCPCLGSHLYQVYGRWCESHGERRRGIKDLISLCGKMPGWRAGSSVPTWTNLKNREIKNRKMVIPTEVIILDNALKRDRFGSNAEWLTACFFAFEQAMGANP